MRTAVLMLMACVGCSGDAELKARLAEAEARLDAAEAERDAAVAKAAKFPPSVEVQPVIYTVADLDAAKDAIDNFMQKYRDATKAAREEMWSFGDDESSADYRVSRDKWKATSDKMGEAYESTECRELRYKVERIEDALRSHSPTGETMRYTVADLDAAKAEFEALQAPLIEAGEKLEAEWKVAFAEYQKSRGNKDREPAAQRETSRLSRQMDEHDKKVEALKASVEYREALYRGERIESALRGN